MELERKDVKETTWISVGDLEISFTGNADSDVDFLLSALRAQINEQIQELKDKFPTAGINTKPQELYIDTLCRVEISITRSETDAEYGSRMKREKARETAKLAKEAKQKAEDIKALIELTKRLGVEVVGGIPAAPVIPKEKEVVKKPVAKARRNLRW